jgi:hypothetical protein
VVWQGSAGDRRPYADQWILTGRFSLRRVYRLAYHRMAPDRALFGSIIRAPYD